MLEINTIKKTFGERTVLDNISFNAQKGQIVSVLGRNGSGKTTLFKTILGLLEPDSGSILFNGRPLKLHEAGYLPEERSLYYDCPVYRQLKHFGLLKGIGKNSIDKEIDRWLDRTGTQEYRDTIPLKLSKGNRQKIQLIAALLADPPLLILDEPWTGLDIDNTELFRKLISEEKRKGKVIILSSHLHQQVQQMCDRFIWLNDGKIQLDVSQKEMEESETRVVCATYDKSFYLQDDDIIKEIYLDKQIKYIVRNNEAACRIAGYLRDYTEVIGLEQRKLTITDLLER